ncbi:bifunctional [glutamate--ammonia ligase]-adenylyl-L-tyrosine phosphorylase/[glutamate--ammonia-ligase] adenylyltransferase [Thioalkalivibrio sp. HK1]|uniref:bifunctional [glutamate--ammonia ligase]-adenylyl-L-tyrosine phosphorylase/[glutamate--ammonia-ligase] adenylyltransferase n=1 Tax=Thioalkalivibrio sp. HK1 TaxID=1469245 RepID=UPI0004AD53B0|nr:bifunctional [glutamate--ammonia ligase]-adenylyl-L-tyrosine phosphorylase/[glutamate--ammonia-ligase] adenylyltransferase [Thioalkalivibrio sp. HK1]
MGAAKIDAMEKPSSWRGDASLPPSLMLTASDRLAELREVSSRDLAAMPGDARRVLACSDFVFTSCLRHPELLEDLLKSGDLAISYPGDSLSSAEDSNLGGGIPFAVRVQQAIEDATSIEDLMESLRRFRRREMVRIAWRDIGGLAPLDETLRDTSELADAMIDSATRRLHEMQRVRLGTPIGETSGKPQQMVVLALGKLGASELNFSSDIDLIFTWPENGQTEGGRRSVENERYFVQLARSLIRTLGEHTKDGFVYRVDMRLRPFGSQGPLAIAFGPMEEYYRNHGRDWERYAMIRARAVSGDQVLVAEFMDELRPFVYRRYLDFATLQSLRELKTVMEREVVLKGMEDSIKHGTGGIREVEFTAQAFQMVRGGRTPRLRHRQLIRVLTLVGELRLLPEEAVRNLIAAYRFLRAAENRLQQVADRQEHILPESDEERLRIAVGMGDADWKRFYERLNRHREAVAAQFAHVFGEEKRGDEEEDDPLGSFFSQESADADPESERESLARAGFDDPEAVWEAIEKSRSIVISRTKGMIAQERLVRLAPDLLREIAKCDNVIETLERVMGVVESICGRSVYFVLLCERAVALSHFVRLCAASSRLSRIFARDPALLSELLDPKTLYTPPEPPGIAADIVRELPDEPNHEEELNGLMRARQANLLRVAAADVSQNAPLMKVSDYLTYIAEETLRAAVKLAWRDMVKRYGRPQTLPENVVSPPYLIIAYGKLGGIELGYGSDLDLVFIHDDDSTATTTGKRPTDLSTFYARLTQRLIHILTTVTPQGILYEVDPRLRPHGGKGVLVNSLDGYGVYLRESAWTWEHQALVRARPVAGDLALGKRFSALRREILLRERDDATLLEDVRGMRHKMRDNLAVRTPGVFDIKQGEGGIVDIEFLVQYVVLRRGSSLLGDDIDFTDNIRLLEGFESAGLMPSEDIRTLAAAYLAYRRRWHQLYFLENPGLVDEGEFGDFPEKVTRIWKTMMDD